MKIVKPLIGLVLILLAVGGLIYWETAGREAVVTDRILVAAVNIAEGEPARADMFTEADVLKENVIDGGLKLEEIKGILGKRAAVDIAAKQQIASAAFTEKEYAMDANKAPFKLEPGWIAGRSSSLRRGDTVGLYDRLGNRSLGAYKVAFVKDSGEQEIMELDNPFAERKILERAGGTAAVSHIEIVATLEEYRLIQSYVEETPGNQILIVQLGDEM